MQRMCEDQNSETGGALCSVDAWRQRTADGDGLERPQGPVCIGLAGLLGVARVNAGSLCSSLVCVYACKEVPAGEGVEGL